MQLRGVVLVEGTSDRRAIEALARRRGRDLEAEGLAVVPMGGYGNLPRLLRRYRGLRVAGLYDVGEERHVLRALGCADRGELERVGFYACTRDLEDELTRAVGPEGMERVLVEQGELRAFRTYQKQPRIAPGRSRSSSTASCGTGSSGTPRSWWMRSTSNGCRGRSTESWRTHECWRRLLDRATSGSPGRSRA
jgi:hypothetical protein